MNKLMEELFRSALLAANEPPSGYPFIAEPTCPHGAVERNGTSLVRCDVTTVRSVRQANIQNVID
ncbi:hypothetical protein KIN20_017821 [Parelaphostrongylus tenuis]|uniref:Uncharacterized protein n=1 Tax=Parelaphostrongylus tenuis TaxID=148309 RepID=A0AAD5MNS3_PARTN|nr:hypothetical protein KIN20_017821 [Parelaphostrongylus tenuis]